MPKIKNKDGSINWDEIKINPVVNTTWGNINESHKDAIDKIKAYIHKRYNEALKDFRKTNKVYNYDEGMTLYGSRKLGQVHICEEILEFIDSINGL